MTARNSGRTRRNRGTTLFLVLVIAMVFFILGIAFSSYVAMEYKISGDSEVAALAFNLADGGTRYMKGKMCQGYFHASESGGTTNLFADWDSATTPLYPPATPIPLPRGYEGDFKVYKDPNQTVNPETVSLTVAGITYTRLYYLISTATVKQGANIIASRSIKFQVATVDQIDKVATAEGESVDRRGIIYRWYEAYR